MDNGDHQLPSSEKIKSWSVSYENLITDEAGIRCFREYLNGNGSGDGSSKMSKRLEFTFVVHGYRSMQDPKDMKEAARSIWKRFVNRSDLHSVLKKETFDKISAFIKSLNNSPLSDSLIRNAFNEAQEEVHDSLANSAYRSFLNSDDYGKLLNNARADECDANFSHRQIPHSSSTHPPPPPPPHPSHRFHSHPHPHPHHPPPPPHPLHTSSHIHSSSNGGETALSYIDQNSSASNASFKAADKINASNHRSQNSVAKARKTIHPPRQLEPLPENSDVKITSNNSLHVPSVANTLSKLRPSRLNNSLYNPTERYQFQGYRGLPPHPYHVEYSTVLPTSAQDSELASYSSGATRSDVASSIDERPDRPITRREMKHHETTVRHDLNVNQAVRAEGVEQNKSKHFVPSLPRKTPNPEKEPEKFAQLIAEKLTEAAKELENDARLMKALELQGANYETLKALTTQEESEEILDSHVRKWSGWGDPTPPVHHSGDVSPLPGRVPPSNWCLRPPNSHLNQNRTLPKYLYPPQPLNHPMSPNERVVDWCQKDTSSVNKKKSSHSVHSGSTKSAKNKSGERAKGVGQSCSNLAMEKPSGKLICHCICLFI